MATSSVSVGLSPKNALIKRSFDIVVSGAGLVATSWIILPAYVVASIETRSSGLFLQERVGRHGKRFRVMKIKTMRPVNGVATTNTRSSDPRITKIGAWLRKTKIDELPQLWNVFWGDMSFVGPRPDVPGYADKLNGEEAAILSIRPGITGPASLKYRDEEMLLAAQDDPEWYNDHVIYPDKVRENLAYLQHWTFLKDVAYIWQTLK